MISSAAVRAPNHAVLDEVSRIKCAMGWREREGESDAEDLHSYATEVVMLRSLLGALTRATELLNAAGEAIGDDGYGMDFTHVDGVETDHIGFSTDCKNAVEHARATLSLIREASQP